LRRRKRLIDIGIAIGIGIEIEQGSIRIVQGIDEFRRRRVYEF